MIYILRIYIASYCTKAWFAQNNLSDCVFFCQTKNKNDHISFVLLASY